MKRIRKKEAARKNNAASTYHIAAICSNMGMFIPTGYILMETIEYGGIRNLPILQTIVLLTIASLSAVLARKFSADYEAHQIYGGLGLAELRAEELKRKEAVILAMQEELDAAKAANGFNGYAE
ncbi:hypothetical protein ACTNDZ_10905 [Selenomonas montiformis]|uniref:hypothetical protein n=1 Tax=Selenomonas montiformis TaxID=2652285 RepID=UPI003F8B9E83